MEFARREAELNYPDENGTPARAHLEEAARKGNASAMRDLDNPCPEDLRYLYDTAVQLVGRSGTSMSGFNALSPTVLRDWCKLTGEEFSAHEVDALFRLDSALRWSPESEKESPAKSEPLEIAPWPQRKSEG